MIEMTVINGCPFVIVGGHAQVTSLLNGHTFRAYVKISSPSRAMETSPYEFKILEFDKKKLKQTNILGNRYIILRHKL